MNDAYETLKTAFLLLVGITVAILGYLGKRNSDKVDSLKETAVTRDELTEAINKIEARQEIRHNENRDVYGEYRGLLERIESKIDANEERASRTRHDTNEYVHGLAMQVAVLTDRGKQ